jgi:hypothetical protein
METPTLVRLTTWGEMDRLLLGPKNFKQAPGGVASMGPIATYPTPRALRCELFKELPYFIIRGKPVSSCVPSTR